MTPALEQFQKSVASVRAKPGMYFGTSGAPAVLYGTHEVLKGILTLAPRGYVGPITVSLAQDGHISIECAELSLGALDPATVDAWIESLWQRSLYYLAFVAAYSDEFILESCDGKMEATWKFSDGAVKTKCVRRRRAPRVQISFRPINEFGRELTDDQLYQLASMLKDLSALRPGLGTRLCAARWPHEMHYYYAHGLRSLLFENDFARHSLHPGCIRFEGEKPGFRVEGYLRFLHAGTPQVRNWVNLHPTQGGAHLVGLGQALAKIFSDPRRGCRPVSFITNSNSGTGVKLPHSFIGAIELNMENPRYWGPTKDILLGDDVRNFVREAALQHIPAQWKELRDARRM